VLARLNAAAVLALIGAFVPCHEAHAAACCGEASVGDRLGETELFMTALRPSVRVRYGSFDQEGLFTANRGSTDLTAEWVSSCVVRVAPKFELGAAVPLVFNFREAQGVQSETGLGFGDTSAFATWLLYSQFQDRYAPGVALTGGVTLPTGAPPQSSESNLGADTTGQGRGEFTFTATLEKTLGGYFHARAISAMTFFVASGDESRARRAPRVLVGPAVGVLFDPVTVIAGFSFDMDLEPSNRQRAEFSLSPFVDLSPTVSLVGDLRSQLPINGLTFAESAAVRAGLGLRVGVLQ
jgi:hypothetical protein